MKDNYIERAVNLYHAKRFSRKLKKYNRALGNKGSPDLSPKPLTKYQRRLKEMKQAVRDKYRIHSAD